MTKYIDAISNNIKEQMKNQMKQDENKIYWLDDKEMGDENLNL
ncbi:hypothetical protein Q5M85_02620 [Paraclostridium bifermentans]|nr:hypothetical protein [Paraclostridium bifermentans]